MNESLQKFARENLIQNLALCTEKEQLFFKRMYSHDNLALPIEQVVANMSEEKLDWAMQQVQRTVDKKAAQPRVERELVLELESIVESIISAAV